MLRTARRASSEQNGHRKRALVQLMHDGEEKKMVGNTSAARRASSRLVAHACQGVLRKLPKSAFVFFIRCRETPLRQESTSGGGFKARSCHPVPFNGAPRRRAPCVIYVCSLDRTAHHARVRFCHIKPLKNRLRARSMDAEGTKR